MLWDFSIRNTTEKNYICMCDHERKENATNCYNFDWTEDKLALMGSLKFRSVPHQA